MDSKRIKVGDRFTHNGVEHVVTSAGRVNVKYRTVGDIDDARHYKSTVSALAALIDAGLIVRTMLAEKVTGLGLRKGMIIDGRQIDSVMQGYGSGRVWTYVDYVEPNDNGSTTGRFSKNTVKYDVLIPVGISEDA